MSNPIVSGSIGGVPAITYLRIQPPIALNNTTTSQSISQMISIDGNVVVIPSDGIHYPQSTRHEVAAVLDRNLSDEDVCEHVVGDLAGASSNGDDMNVKGLLNPIRAFVNDAASATLLVVGSKSTRKSRFYKKTLLPFVANEIFSCMNKVNDFSGSELNGEVVDIQLSVSSFEIQDEIVSDLLRPQSRGLSINMGIFDGVRVRGLFIQPVTDESTLRRILNESCDNRVSHAQPLGGNIDTSSAIWQFELTQRVANSQGKLSVCYSRLILIDAPSVDVLAELPNGSNNQTSQLKHLQSLSLHKSLVSLVEVIKRLATHPNEKIDNRSDSKVDSKQNNKVAPKGYSKAHLAPFESSNLTMFLSEVLGGDSLIIGIGLLADGESRVSRRTIDLINALALTTHFPVSNRRDNERGVADLVKGLVCKYRSMILALQDQLLVNDNKSIGEGDGNTNTKELEKKIDSLQKDVLSLNVENAEIKRDRDAVIEVLDLLKSKYQTLLSDKLVANETIIRLEDEREQLMNELKEKTNEIDSDKKTISELNNQLVIKNEIVEKLNNEIENFKIDKQQITEGLNNEKTSNDNNLAIIQKLRESLVNEEERSLELGAEVITLSNQVEEITKQRESDKQANIPLVGQIEKLNNEIDRLKEQINDRDIAIDRYKSLKESKYSKRILSPETSNKSIKEFKKQLDRQIDDCNRYRKVNSQLVNEIESLRSDYRSRIERAIIYGERNNQVVKNDFTSEEEELLSSLMTSFNKRENQLVESIKLLETEYETYKLLCRTLYDKLDECIDKVLVDKQIDNQLDSERQLIDECKQQLLNAEALLTKPIDDRLDIQTLNDSTDHQKLLLLVHSYKRHVYQSESRLAESQRQVADLSIQLQQLMKQKQVVNELDRGVDRLPVIHTPKKELVVSQSLSMLPSSNQIRKDSISSDYKQLTIQLKDSERKSIELNQKTISLETELNDYKQYMRSTVLQYKRQIETLAKQLDIQNNKLTN